MTKNTLLVLSICLVAFTMSQTAQNVEGVPFKNVDNHGYQADGSMDLTFARSAQQKTQFIENAGRVEAGTSFLEHMFETDGDDDFHFTLPVEQQIAFYAYAYVVEDNTYVRLRDVNVQPAVRLAVYEGGEMIVKSNFFFQKYVLFNGKKDTKYEIKIQTSGNKKLISLSIKLFVEEADIMKIMKKNEVEKYSVQGRELKSQLLQLSNKFGVYKIIDENNLRHSVINVRKYYYFELLQIIVVAVASYLQITTIFKLLKSNSIIV